MMRRTAALILAPAAIGCGGGDDEESASEPAATSQADAAATVAPRRDEICAGPAERVGRFNKLDEPGPDDVKTFSRDLGRLSDDAAAELAATPGDPQVDAFRRALEQQAKALADVEQSAGQSGRGIDDALTKLDRAFQRVRKTAKELGALVDVDGLTPNERPAAGA